MLAPGIHQQSVRLRRQPVLFALAVFVLLAIVQTWPLARDPAHLSRVDNGDAQLNIWAIAWVAHQLPRDPLHLFDANIFYPERLTLAYSEAMLLQGTLSLPILAAGGSPVLAYSLVLLAGFALTGWAFCLLVWRWTGSWSAGYLAGSLAAFNSHVLVRLAHLQTQHVEFIALMLFALDRLVMGRRTRDALLLGVAFALQGLTSVYLLVFSTWTLLFAGASRAREFLKGDAGRRVAQLALAGGVGVLLMAPYLYAYAQLHQLTGWARAVDDQWPASWRDYLATGSRLHYPLWSDRFFATAYSSNFPGVVALALAILAMICPENRRDVRFRMCVVAALGCLAVSFATYLPFYPVLHRLVPLFQAVRVPAHLGQIVLLMIAIVAGFGLAGLERRWTHAPTWPVVAFAACALVNVEAFRAPIGWVRFEGVPSIYDVLAREREAVIVEMPFPAPRQWSLNGKYMLNSTRHWHPMLNGYSGFRPASYGDAHEELRGFPDRRSLAALHARGVTHVVVHAQDFITLWGRDQFGAVAQSPSLQPLAADGHIAIYRLRGQ